MPDMAALGALGGATTRAKYGKEYLRNIAAIGGRASKGVRKKRRPPIGHVPEFISPADVADEFASFAENIVGVKAFKFNEAQRALYSRLVAELDAK